MVRERPDGTAARLGLKVVMGVNLENWYRPDTTACSAADLERSARGVWAGGVRGGVEGQVSQVVPSPSAIRRIPARCVARDRGHGENTTVGVAGLGLIGDAPLAEHRGVVHLGFTRWRPVSLNRSAGGLRLRTSAEYPAFFANWAAASDGSGRGGVVGIAVQY